MIQILKQLKLIIRNYRIHKSGIELRRNIKNKNFSIICNNCWGGGIYQQMKLSYNTPFVGLYIFADDYIRLLSDFEQNMNNQLKFIKTSKYEKANKDRIQFKLNYPIGLLGDNIEIHFLHYYDENEAIDKWNRRKDRMNWDNLYFVFSERDLCEPRHIQKFAELNLPNKVCFTANNYSNLDSTVWIKDYEKDGQVGDIYTYNNLVYKYFDPVKWLNNKEYKL